MRPELSADMPAPTGVIVLSPRPAPIPEKDLSNMHLARGKGAWLVRYPSYHPRAGKYETFSDSVYGSADAALAVARNRRDQAFTEVGLPIHLRIRHAKTQGRTGLAGVALSFNRGDPTRWSSWRWVAHWVEDRQVKRSFGIHSNGFNGALDRAIEVRECMTGVRLDPMAVFVARAMQFKPPPARLKATPADERC